MSGDIQVLNEHGLPCRNCRAEPRVLVNGCYCSIKCQREDSRPGTRVWRLSIRGRLRGLEKSMRLSGEGLHRSGAAVQYLHRRSNQLWWLVVVSLLINAALGVAIVGLSLS